MEAGRPVESGEIADEVFLRCRILWSGTSQRLKILEEAGLVVAWMQGPYRHHGPDRRALAPVRAWAEVVVGPAR